MYKENKSCEVSEAKSGECFQEEGVAGCVLNCGESSKKERTRDSQGFSSTEIVGDLDKSNFSGR